VLAASAGEPDDAVVHASEWVQELDAAQNPAAASEATTGPLDAWMPDPSAVAEQASASQTLDNRALFAADGGEDAADALSESDTPPAQSDVSLTDPADTDTDADSNEEAQDEPASPNTDEWKP
jgi:hypothetical protein